MSQIEVLLGKTLTSVEVNHDKDVILFKTDDGKEYIMYHESDCCECVTIDDINGDLNDLVGSPITRATEETSCNHYAEPDNNAESFTWTFYKLATLKGWVDIRWFGESNGYYSEDVTFREKKS